MVMTPTCRISPSWLNTSRVAPSMFILWPWLLLLPQAPLWPCFALGLTAWPQWISTLLPPAMVVVVVWLVVAIVSRCPGSCCSFFKALA